MPGARASRSRCTSTISISVRRVVLSSVWYVIDLSYSIPKAMSMAAPPQYGTLRPWRGRPIMPIPPGTGAIVVSPSTDHKAVWTSSPVVAGSVQSGNTSALTASAKVTQFSGRSLQHPGLGSLPPSNRSPVVAMITPVAAVVPDRDGLRPQLRADPAGLHAGNDQTRFRHHEVSRVSRLLDR